MQPDLEPRLLALLAPQTPTDGAHLAFTHLELQLTELFGALTVDESRALHIRLAIPAPDDPVAALFGRLARPRRERLILFLADARRRAARAASGIR